jgi:hypothetical protein
MPFRIGMGIMSEKLEEESGDGRRSAFTGMQNIGMQYHAERSLNASMSDGSGLRRKRTLRFDSNALCRQSAREAVACFRRGVLFSAPTVVVVHSRFRRRCKRRFVVMCQFDEHAACSVHEQKNY